MPPPPPPAAAAAAGKKRFMSQSRSSCSCSEKRYCRRSGRRYRAVPGVTGWCYRASVRPPTPARGPATPRHQPARTPTHKCTRLFCEANRRLKPRTKPNGRIVIESHCIYGCRIICCKYTSRWVIYGSVSGFHRHLCVDVLAGWCPGRRRAPLSPRQQGAQRPFTTTTTTGTAPTG